MSRNHLKINPRLWHRARITTFKADGYRCRQCGRAGRLECDHVRPLQRGGHPLALDNLQTLCRGCHLAKTSLENRRQRTGHEQAWRKLVSELML